MYNQALSLSIKILKKSDIFFKTSFDFKIQYVTSREFLTRKPTQIGYLDLAVNKGQGTAQRGMNASSEFMKSFYTQECDTNKNMAHFCKMKSFKNNPK